MSWLWIKTFSPTCSRLTNFYLFRKIRERWLPSRTFRFTLRYIFLNWVPRLSKSIELFEDIELSMHEWLVSLFTCDWFGKDWHNSDWHKSFLSRIRPKFQKNRYLRFKTKDNLWRNCSTARVYRSIMCKNNLTSQFSPIDSSFRYVAMEVSTHCLFRNSTFPLVQGDHFVLVAWVVPNSSRKVEK